MPKITKKSLHNVALDAVRRGKVDEVLADCKINTPEFHDALVKEIKAVKLMKLAFAGAATP